MKLESGTDSLHLRYPHVYAVIRFDSASAGIEQLVTVTKVLSNKVDAQNEVKRLNTLNGPKGVMYAMQLTRFVELSDGPPNSED